MIPAACSTMCNNMVALPLMSIVWNSLPAEDFSAPVFPAAKGHTGPPDPYPPRPIVLS